MLSIASLQIELDSRRAKEAKKAMDEFSQSADNAKRAVEALSSSNQEALIRYRQLGDAASQRQQALQAEAQAHATVAAAEQSATKAVHGRGQALDVVASASGRSRADLDKWRSQADMMASGLAHAAVTEQTLAQAFQKGKLDAALYTDAIFALNTQSQQLDVQKVQQFSQAMGKAVAVAKRLTETPETERQDSSWWDDVSKAVEVVDTIETIGSIGAGIIAAGPVAMVGAGVAATVGTAGFAYYQGAKEFDRYNEALTVSGNPAKITNYQLAEMANNVKAVVGTTFQATEALVLLTESGMKSSQNFELMAQAAIGMSVATGKSIKKTIDEFALIEKDPIRAIEFFQNKYGMLNGEIEENIRILMAQGKVREAIDVLEKKSANEFFQRSERIKNSWSGVEKALNSVTNTFMRTWDAARGIGRNDEFVGLDEKIKEVKERINANEELINKINNDKSLMDSTKKSGIKFALQEKEKYENELKGYIARKVMLDQHSLWAKYGGGPPGTGSESEVGESRGIGSGMGAKERIERKGRKNSISSEMLCKNYCCGNLGEEISRKNYDIFDDKVKGGDRSGVVDDVEKERNELGYLKISEDMIYGGGRQYKDWWEEVGDGLTDYSQNTGDMFERLNKTVIGVFDSMGQSLSKFVMTGKLEFKGLADSIIENLVQIAIQQSIVGPLAGLFGGLFGGGSGNLTGASLVGATWGPLLPLSSGGYTGDGGRYEPAGIVHRGEGVLNQDEIRAIGGEAGFNALRRAIRGPRHSMGGMAGAPALPPAISGGAGQAPVQVNIEINGSDQQIQTQSSDGLESFAKLMGEIARSEYQKLQLRSYQGGGMAWQAQQGAFR
ncbi:phage tail length tape measure family protein [Alcaligenes sp. WGS1538]|uniref:phage tail length tape measure family protein n=1 Tax=Alcaligenes sp. WGS1538 TaxID=3366811 RepID=UPI00372D3560